MFCQLRGVDRTFIKRKGVYERSLLIPKLRKFRTCKKIRNGNAHV